MSSKRTSLGIDKKVAIIRAYRTRQKKKCCWKKFRAKPLHCVWYLAEQGEDTTSWSEGKFPKELKKPKYEDLDRAVIDWYEKEQANTPLSGRIIKAKAEYFAKQLDITDFKASEGWLGKFKQRHGINFSQRCGSTQDIEMEATTSVRLNTERGLNDETVTSDTLQIKTECVLVDDDSVCGTDQEDREVTPAALSLWDEEIQSTLIKDEQNFKENEVSNDSPPTLQQALDALKVLQKFLLFRKRVFHT